MASKDKKTSKSKASAAKAKAEAAKEQAALLVAEAEAEEAAEAAAEAAEAAEAAVAAEPEPEEITLTMEDLVQVINIINYASKGGAFEASICTEVGLSHDLIASYIRQSQPVTEETPEVPAEERVELSLEAIIKAANIINHACKAGAFEASLCEQVGHVYNRVVGYVRQNQPEPTEATEGGEDPVEGNAEETA